MSILDDETPDDQFERTLPEDRVDYDEMDRSVFEDPVSAKDFRPASTLGQLSEKATSGSPQFASTPPLAPLTVEIVDYFNEYPGPAPINTVLTHSTERYLEELDPDQDYDPSHIEMGLLHLANAAITATNHKMSTPRDRHPAAKVLKPHQIALVLRRLCRVVRIAPSNMSTDREYDLLGLYRKAGDDQGTYSTSEEDLRTVARKFNAQLSKNDFQEVFSGLRDIAPRVTQCAERDLVPVNNGVFHYGTEDAEMTINGRVFQFKAKTLHEFDPAFVFLSKSRVNYVANAPKQVITHPVDGEWEITEWVADLFHIEDENDFNAQNAGMAELVWEVLGAIIRPYVRWGKTAWFYSERGNNGKGTLCSLMRNLVGHGAHTSISLSELGSDFALEPLLRANAIIVDENDVGTYIDKAANLKTIVTNDILQINRKHRTAIAFQFWGLMVQCLNEFPRMKDKSESSYRRQLFMPFSKCFTGAERKYIKNDYLQRPKVLEYALWYVLHEAGAETPGSYYEFSEPLATRAVLSEYKEYNDPVRSFWDEFREQFVWDLLPFTFLYDLYKSWFQKTSPSGSPLSRPQFIRDLLSVVENDLTWECRDKDKKIRPADLMNDPETLIADFELRDWYSPRFNPHDRKSYTELGREGISSPAIKSIYRGILRKNPVSWDDKLAARAASKAQLLAAEAAHRAERDAQTSQPTTTAPWANR